MDKNLKFLSEDKSFSYDPKAGTFKLGDKTLKLSDVKSKAAMAAAGIPSSLIDQTWAEAEKAAQDAEKKVAAVDKDGQGGGGGYGGGSGITDIVVVEDGAGEDLYGNNGKNGKDKQPRDPAGVAGMSKSYYGTPIGVAMDNIFLMMNRRYIVKDKQNTFFGKSETPPSP
ncbi:MAG TPA: hypothetical protein PLJ21_12050 [Pseudobdellovibrionaceae bacterium]|nr:hypothetical protein [Pseudobdellovibrionaceae bacterium]